MIVVIKEGHIEVPKKYKYRITCEHCGCIFEAEKGDEFDVVRRQGFFDKAWNCPYCKKIISDGQGGGAIVKWIVIND